MLRGICKTCKECHPRDPEFFVIQLVRVSTDNALVPCSPLHPFAPTIAPSYLSAHPLGKPRERVPSHNLGTVNALAGTRNWGRRRKLLTDSSPRAKSSVNPS